VIAKGAAMPHQKIATCTYCGTRAALVLSGTTQHELACRACGAPLHDLKMLRADAVGDGYLHARGTKKAKGAPVDRVRATPLPIWQSRSSGKTKKKKRKSLGKRFLKEAFDMLEDIFD
jgi:hypothetical protein